MQTLIDKPLNGKKVAILVETEYIHKEMEFYKDFFAKQGAEVHFLSLLWGAEQRKIIADITDAENPIDNIHTMIVDKDVKDYDPNDYAIVLAGANYVTVRLREIEPMGSLGSVKELATPPAVDFFARAMKNKKIVKGCLCHALWILTPVPELLKGRRVICHSVVLADVHNAGGIFAPDDTDFAPDSPRVVVDDDLVTGRSSADLESYTAALLETYKKINEQEES